jgi:hypothetical protein
MLSEDPSGWYLSVNAEDMFVALGERLKRGKRYKYIAPERQY